MFPFIAAASSSDVAAFMVAYIGYRTGSIKPSFGPISIALGTVQRKGEVANRHKADPSCHSLSEYPEIRESSMQLWQRPYLSRGATRDKGDDLDGGEP